MANTRRTFLKQAAGVTAAHFFGVPALTGAEPGSVAGNPGWYDRPMRWAQLAFVEDDPGNYDLAFWLDYFQKIHAELAWMNDPVDPNVCGCRHLLCCEKTTHSPGRCPLAPTEKMWSFRQEYLCAPCRSYHFSGDRNAWLHDSEVEAFNGALVRYTDNSSIEATTALSLLILPRR